MCPGTGNRNSDKLTGIIAVLSTPFCEDGSIDTESAARHAEYAIDAGVSGFLVPALAGEVGKLKDRERHILVDTIVTTVRGRVPVIGGAGAFTPEARLAMVQDLVRLGCDGVLANIPFTTEAEYENSIRDIARLDPGFIMIQDWDASGYGLPDTLILRLFETIPAFRCLKVETVPAGMKYSNILAATGGTLHVSGGWAVTQMIEGLDRGVHAFMPTGMYEIYVRIFTLHRAGRREEAAELFRKLVPILAFSNQHLDISIHFFKRLLKCQGIYSTDLVRQPSLDFDKYHARIADELIGLALALIEELKTGYASPSRIPDLWRDTCAESDSAINSETCNVPVTGRHHNSIRQE